MTTSATTAPQLTAQLRPWLPDLQALHVLEVGCATADEAGALLELGAVTEYVGVDLDESAIKRARDRWPQATFLCADAARLPARYHGALDVILIRRPDLLAQPKRWREVFAALPTLLHAQGRILVRLIGEGETQLARAWWADEGCEAVHVGALDLPDKQRLLVAEIANASVPIKPPLKLIQFDAGADEGAYCDPLTGKCFTPGVEILDDDARD